MALGVDSNDQSGNQPNLFEQIVYVALETNTVKCVMEYQILLFFPVFTSKTAHLT